MDGFIQRQTIDLGQSNPVLVREQPIIKGDAQALIWIVTIRKNGALVDLTGAEASLYCARSASGSEGESSTTFSGATVDSDGTVTATLPTDAANIPGPVGCMIRVTRDGASVAVARMAVMAVDLTGDDIIDEGERVPNLDEVVAAVLRCEKAADKAEAAALKIDTMTVTATGLDAGSAPTAELTEVDGRYNLALGVPKGDKGETGETGPQGAAGPQGEPGQDAVIDATLTKEGEAADAKAAGEALNRLKEDLGDLEIDFDSIVSTNKTPIFGEDKLLGDKPNFTAISLLGKTIEIDNTDSHITSTMVFVHNVEKNKKYNINLNIISGLIDTFRVSSYSNTTFINELNVDGKQNYSFTMDDNSRIQIVITVRYNCPVLKATNCYFAESDSKTTISLEALPEIPDSKILEISQDKIRNEYIDTNDSLYASKQLGMAYLYTNGLFDTKVKDGDYEVIGGALSETGSVRIGIEAKTGNKTTSYPRLKIYDKYGEAKIFDKIMYEAGNVINPSVETNILFVGDSLIAYKYFSKHFKNYLHNLGLTNYKLIGRVTDNTDAENKFEATGGYSWNNYVDDPSTLPSKYPNNWFWYNGKIDLNHYVETYCDGKTPNYIICNLGWNHKLNPYYSSDMDTIKSLCRKFLDAVHEQYPDCKIILNGIHHGMPNTFAYTLDYKKFAIELGHAYNAVSKETAYKNFVIYCDVAPYFDATIGMQTKTRTAWGKEQTYVSDYGHPNEEGYKMHAFADICAFLYLVS